MTAHEPDRVTVQATASRPALMVLADNYYTGWKATVDGRETPIIRTNHTLRGVVVPAGTHAVEFTFHPDDLYTGFYLYLAGFGAAGGVRGVPADPHAQTARGGGAAPGPAADRDVSLRRGSTRDGRMNSRQHPHEVRLRGLSVTGECHAGTGSASGQPPPGVFGGGASLGERRGRRWGSALVTEGVPSAGIRPVGIHPSSVPPAGIHPRSVRPSERMNSPLEMREVRLRGLSVAGGCHAGTGSASGQPPPGVFGGGASLGERRGRRWDSAPATEGSTRDGRMTSRQQPHEVRRRGLSVTGGCHAGTASASEQPPPGVFGGGASLGERRGRRWDSAPATSSIPPMVLRG